LGRSLSPRIETREIFRQGEKRREKGDQDNEIETKREGDHGYNNPNREAMK